MGISKIITNFCFKAGKKLSSTPQVKKISENFMAEVKTLSSKAKPLSLSKERLYGGEILAKQTAKRSAQAPVFTSTPTQEYIDRMIGVEKIDALKTEGMFDRRRCANAMAAFKAQGKPSVVKSVPTQQAVDELNATRVIEELKTYEKTGQLSPKMLEKRLDVYQAVYRDEGLPVVQDYIAQQRKVLEDLKKTYKPQADVTQAESGIYGKMKLAKPVGTFTKSDYKIDKNYAKILKKYKP